MEEVFLSNLTGDLKDALNTADKAQRGEKFRMLNVRFKELLTEKLGADAAKADAAGRSAAAALGIAIFAILPTAGPPVKKR